MLDDNQPDPTSTEAGAGDTEPTTASEATAPPAKKAARKAPAKKAATKRAPAKKAAAKKVAAPAEAPSAGDAPEAPETTSAEAAAPAPAKKAAARRPAAKRTTKQVAPAIVDEPTQAPAADPAEAAAPAEEADGAAAPVKKAAAKRSAAKKTAERAPARRSAAKKSAGTPADAPVEAAVEQADQTGAAEAAAGAVAPLFQAPTTTTTTTRRSRSSAKKTAAPAAETPVDEDAALDEELADEAAVEPSSEAAETEGETDVETEGESDAETDAETEGETDAENEGGAPRRRRRRGGRRRRKPGDSAQSGSEGDGSEEAAEGGDNGADADESGTGDTADSAGAGEERNGESTSSRRRRRRRRSGDEAADSDDEANTVTRVRSARSAEDQITAVSGSTRLEAKKQRRREGREAGRRRAPIVSEAEFLARRESVDRVMVIRQRDELTQIAVLEDKVLVEHYVARESQTSLIGNVYLGRVQNVLPSMEAAFIDIGKGRNAVLYAGEVNWSALGHKDGQPRKIESVLSSGQSILVQVTKDPVGHKGARLTSQISLAGRFLVYVPDGTTSGISRKLPDTERNRLKTLLKEIVPDSAGVIVRTAAEGASEDELTRDVERLKARWEDIEAKARGNAPQLLYGEPDLTLKVVRDLFTEDFSRLVIQGDDAWDTVQGYVAHVAPDLQDRLERFEPGENGKDVFAAHRIEEQIRKGLDRKVWLPSGGSLIIDRTEAMTVVDVNTGKFTGSGGNLEETVTKNNLEAAEEIVRQLRLRDIGGIIVIDFIDMVLESNRDLVVRRLVECLGRDRTRHQVAEVTSLGLVQMTRKRIGTGLLEAFSKDCEHCQGRGVIILDTPVEPSKGEDDRRGRRTRGRAKGEGGNGQGAHGETGGAAAPSPKTVASKARGEGKPGQARADGARPDEDKTDQPREAAVEPSSVVEVSPEPGVASVEPASSFEAGPTEPSPASEPSTEPVVEPVVETAAEPEQVETTRPRVTTTTRRRAASRPAGPPDGVPGAPATAQIEPGTADHEPGADVVPEPHVEHVPIKKKGSRKR